MCGIVGLVYSDPTRPCCAETVTGMRDVFPYRGPDDAGLHLDGHAGLGHRRLSIIDLSGGHQPMSSSDGRFWIVFNGEIYNFRGLRRDLRSKGCVLRTESDTEVILQLYADLGERCVGELNGMFAFAIWDSRERSLFLARDRMGVKPLYYAHTTAGFAFGSEIKAVLASGLVPSRWREEALAEYLVFRQAAGNDTMFAGVSSLPPASTMMLADGRTRLARYWSLGQQGVGGVANYEETQQKLADLLQESVRLRMISDVPLGTFCSGGVDSSLVTAIAAKMKDEPINTFSVGFDEPEYDESAYAAIVSRLYATVHHTLRVDNATFSDLLPRMVWHNDEPLNFANSVQIYAVSQLAREHVTVVLTGEGSDELFAGYPRYRLPAWVSRYRRVPGPVRRLLRAFVHDHRLRKLERFVDVEADDVLLFNNSTVTPVEVGRVCPRLGPADTTWRRRCLARSEGQDPISRLSLQDQDTYLVSILHRQDKMSMAASIESRVPFMDYRIVELANQMPSSYKLRRGSGKAIIKDIASSMLPKSVVHRRKSGFGVPLDRWFRTDVGVGERLVAMASAAPQEPFDRAALGQLVLEHRRGQSDHSELLWSVMNVYLWREAFRC